MTEGHYSEGLNKARLGFVPTPNPAGRNGGCVPCPGQCEGLTRTWGPCFRQARIRGWTSQCGPVPALTASWLGAATVITEASRERESLGVYAADLHLYGVQQCISHQCICILYAAYPTFNGSQQKELQAIVQGLQAERLREHICLSAPGSLVAALD